MDEIAGVRPLIGRYKDYYAICVELRRSLQKLQKQE